MPYHGKIKKKPKVVRSTHKIQLIEFVDTNKKERKARSLVISEHKGDLFVEAHIVGNVREWIEWYPLSEFQELNPDLVLRRKK